MIFSPSVRVCVYVIILIQTFIKGLVARGRRAGFDNIGEINMGIHKFWLSGIDHIGPIINNPIAGLGRTISI